MNPRIGKWFMLVTRPLSCIVTGTRELQLQPKSTVKASNKSDTNHDGSLDNPIEPLVLVERLDLDLTDLLWNVLNKVESLDELKKAWEYIFQVFDKEGC